MALPELPTEIICFRILPRLPAKSLMRFKSVCKPWSSMIGGRSDPLFLSNHRNLHLNMRMYPHILFNVFDKKTELEHLVAVRGVGGTSTTPLSATRLLTLPSKCRLHFNYQCTNGLICFRLVNNIFPDPYVHIFNPCTRDSIILSSSVTYHGYWLDVERYSSGLRFIRDPVTDKLEVLPHDQLNLNFFLRRLEYHFGYSPRTNEYKLIEACEYHILGMSRRAIKILTLGDTTTGGSNSWRNIEINQTDLLGNHLWERSHDTPHVCVHGALHWLLINEDYNIIVAFDLGDEKFKAIPLPSNQGQGDADDRYLNGRRLVEVDGCLALTDDKPLKNKKKELWILKHYENKMWVKETIIFSSNWYTTVPTCSVHKGELLLRSADYPLYSLHLLLYNRESKTFRDTKINLPEGISQNTCQLGFFTSCDERIGPLRF